MLARHEALANALQLEIIHEYIEERATNRINWIIIWLIIVACIVEAVSLMTMPSTCISETLWLTIAREKWLLG